MGNHSIGAAFVACAETAAERRRPGESALEILDAAADKSGVRGMDAEFDDAIMFGAPFTTLIIEAFGEGDVFPDCYEDDVASEEAWTRFYSGPYEKFNRRYELC